MKKLITILFLTASLLSITTPVIASPIPNMPEKIIMFQTNNEFLPVYQQPLNQTSYVTNNPSVLNQVWSEKISGYILFAHNNLAGEIFTHMEVFQQIIVTYSTGRKEVFQVVGFKEVLRGTTTMLNNPDYNNPNILVMQTCIDDKTAMLVITYKIN